MLCVWKSFLGCCGRELFVGDEALDHRILCCPQKIYFELGPSLICRVFERSFRACCVKDFCGDDVIVCKLYELAI